MYWVFIVCRESSVERTKVFSDYWDGVEFVDNFLRNINPHLKNFPHYNRNEYYTDGNLTIGLYKSE